MHDKRTRSAGELALNAGLFIVSLALLWSAYGISGFESLACPAPCRWRLPL